jgi:heme exporter protein A
MPDRNSPSAPALEARDLTLQRGGRTIIASVTLAINPGELFLLHGPNGSGKTTLLRALAGFSRPAGGTLRRVFGQTIFLGHADAVKAAFTAKENIDFWSALYDAAPTAIEHAISVLRIFPFLNQRAGGLSSGQRRRLALCRVMIARRPIWLLDEPTSGMDAASVATAVDLIAEHCRSGGSAVIATHEPLSFDGARRIKLAEAA